jgi:DNA uptake protein ComE-like DNA-binding protein
MRKRGSILVGVLWCMTLLSVVVIGVLHTASLNLRVVKNYGDRMQAHYLALAGVEKAKALLYQDAVNRRRTSKNHGGELYNDPQDFRDVAFGRGQFRVFRRGRPDEGGGVVFGVSDEESRLNVNYAATNEFSNLQDMTPDVVAAIIDWRDTDNETSPGGAEADYYTALLPPYLPRNGPLLTTRELLMVRGVSPQLLLGRDRRQNGLLGYGGEKEENAPLSDDPTGLTDTGWAGLMTVDSTVQNMNAAGQERVNVQQADENSLSAVRGITPAIAKAIVASRGQNRLETLADLLDVSAPQNQGPNQGGGNQPNQNPPDGQNPQGIQGVPGGQDAPTGPDGSPLPQNNPQGAQNAGPKVISEELLMDIADDLTVDSTPDLPGLVNINTASLAVLTCLPGLDRQSAQAIISFRQSNGFLPNIAWLLKVPGIDRGVLKQLAPRITARSETYRILSEGKVSSTGVRQRIQVIIHLGLRDIDTLSYREDL